MLNVAYWLYGQEAFLFLCKKKILIILTVILELCKLVFIIKTILKFKKGEIMFKIGPFDPISLSVNIINVLIEKKVITVDESEIILREAMTGITDMEKDGIIKAMRGGKDGE